MAADLSLDLVIADPGDAGAIPNTDWGTCRLVTSGAETRTLAAPTAIGPRVLLTMETDGGDCVVTVGGSGYDQDGNTTLTFADVGDFALLEAALESTGTFCWRLVSYDGVSGPEHTIDDLIADALTVATITASGACTFNGTVDINDATTCRGVTQDATYTAALQTVTVAATLTVTGASTTAGITDSGTIAGTNGTFSGTLDVDGTTTLDETEVDGTYTQKDGGTVTQLTNITTGVTLNTNVGQITTVSSTLAAGAEATFVVTNSNVAAVDNVLVHMGSTSSAGTPIAFCSAVAAGNFDITITNLHAADALDNTLTIHFQVFKGSATT